MKPLANGKFRSITIMPSAESPRRLVKTALHQAVLDNRLHQVRLLVCRHGVDVDSRDLFGRTPLMLACLLSDENDGYRMSKILLAAGTYVNIKDNLQRTALHYACMKGRERLVRRLLREDVTEVSAVDIDGNTPLMHAAMAGFPNIVSLLMDATMRFGTSVDERNQAGYTALLLACKYAHYASAYELLTKGGADPNVRDNEFFFTATQWLQRCRELHASFQQQQPQHGDAPPPRYARENRMYSQQHDRPGCSHAHVHAHPLGQSLDTALRLPVIFSHLPVERPLERNLGDKDARVALIRAIDAVERARTTRSSVSRSTSRGRGAMSRAAHVSTAKLSSLHGRKPAHTSMAPDMTMLFKMYTDQFENKCLISARHHSKPKHIRIKTPSSCQI